MAKLSASPIPLGIEAEEYDEPEEYFFVADFDPEDPDMFDNEMYGDPLDFSPEGLQAAMALLEEAKADGGSYNIYRRKWDEDRGGSEEEPILDPMNYRFPKRK